MHLWAQKQTLVGFVFDLNTSVPLSGVVVSVSGLDSVSSVTNDLGFFRINDLDMNLRFSLIFSHASYKTAHHDISSTKELIQATYMFLESETNIDSNEMEANNKRSFLYNPINDKLIFYTSALQQYTHGTIEDYITTLPILLTEEESSYSLGIDKISDITINGNTFFISNNLAVIKNIPASFIKRAEVYEDKNSVTDLSGFENRNYSKVLDLFTDDVKKGLISSQVYAGISNLDRWNTGGSLNFFDGDRIFGIIINSNNTNDRKSSSLNLTNLEGFSNISNFDSRFSFTPDARYSSFFGSINDFVIDQSNGINENLIFGATYFDVHKKWSFNGNYFFNKTGNETEAQYKRIYFANSIDSLTYYESSFAKSTHISHRFNASATYTIDSLQSLSLEAILYLQKSQGDTRIQAEYRYPRATKSDSLGIILSEATNQSSIQSDAVSLQFPLSFKKKFRSNNRRTMRLALTPFIYNEKRPGFLESDYVVNWGPRIGPQHNNILLDNTIRNQINSLNTDFTYSEPITTSLSLLFSWKGQLQENKYSISTHHFFSSNPFLTDSSVSLQMKQHVLQNNYGVFYLFKPGNFIITQGAILQQLNYVINKESPTTYTSPNTTKTYVLPSLFVTYKPVPNSHLKLEYERSTRIPDISQTKDVLSINNSLNLERGNLELSPSILDFIQAKYTYVNPEKARFFQVAFSVSIMDDYVGKSTLHADSTLSSEISKLSEGFTITQFQNLKGWFLLNSFANYSIFFPSLYFNMDMFIQNIHANVPSVFNNESFFTRENTSRIGISFKSEINENFVFSIGSNTAYHHIGNTLASKSTSKYLTQSFTCSFYSFWFKSLRLITSVNNQNSYSISNNFENTHFLLVNMSLGYCFLSDKSMEIKFSVHDVFNKNGSLQYSYTDTYTEELRTNNLKRFFMLTLTYNLQAHQVKKSNL